MFVQADLAKVADCRKVVAAAEKRFGRVDALVNAAGLSDRGDIFDTTEERFNEIFDVNVRAPFFLIQETVRIMRRLKIAGAIVNIQSVSGHGGQPFIAAYCASKGALATLTRNVAHSLLKFRIRVNGLNIGWMSTPGEDRIMKTYHGAKDGWLEEAVKSRPFGRLLDPKEVARACAFLCSDESGLDDWLEHRLRPERRRHGRPAARALNRSSPVPSEPRLDVITIGRSSVDLYGVQVGGRLEDMATFSKAVGGCPTNIAIGTARLGLKSGLITRVGDEHMGRFIREQCAREGVDVAGVRTDPVRLTSLVLLGIRDEKTFPLIFYRDNCADSALDEGDIDPAFVESARAILVSGTHFARPNTAAAQLKAMRIARAAGRKVVFDIDYRPNLWGLAGHGAGEERYIKSSGVTRSLSAILPQCDLIVGTEEEMMIAGGADEPLEALKAVRTASAATLVLKRGPMGCVVFPGVIPDSLDHGIKGPGFPVEVYNVLGAGDAFMSGFLRGWLRDEPLETCCAYANANGAFAVSRLLCSAEYPTWAELSRFLERGSPHRALRRDETLNHIHWATTRRPEPPSIMALAIDHRAQLEKIADDAGSPRERISAFKLLAVEAAAQSRGRPAGLWHAARRQVRPRGVVPRPRS